jgi:hypothetical protein
MLDRFANRFQLLLRITLILSSVQGFTASPLRTAGFNPRKASALPYHPSGAEAPRGLKIRRPRSKVHFCGYQSRVGA